MPKLAGKEQEAKNTEQSSKQTKMERRVCEHHLRCRHHEVKTRFLCDAQDNRKHDSNAVGYEDSRRNAWHSLGTRIQAIANNEPAMAVVGCTDVTPSCASNSACRISRPDLSAQLSHNRERQRSRRLSTQSKRRQLSTVRRRRIPLVMLKEVMVNASSNLRD